MWRKIMITPKQGNWYKVAYEDSHGGVARRAIHKHRIKKFTRHILQLKNSSVRCDSEGITRLTVQMAFCTDHFDIPICNGKKLEKMRHTLKIWK